MFKRILSVLALMVGTMLPAQQPQTIDIGPTINPIFATNAKYVNGVAPGYWPTNPSGTGLVLNLSAGTANCSLTIVNYAGGTLTLVNNTVNYVYLDGNATCAPASSTSAFSGKQIPIATVTTSGGKIISIADVRTMLILPPTGGGGSCGPLSDVTVTDCGTGNSSGTTLHTAPANVATFGDANNQNGTYIPQLLAFYGNNNGNNNKISNIYSPKYLGAFGFNNLQFNGGYVGNDPTGVYMWAFGGNNSVPNVGIVSPTCNEVNMTLVGSNNENPCFEGSSSFNYTLGDFNFNLTLASGVHNLLQAQYSTAIGNNNFSGTSASTVGYNYFAPIAIGDFNINNAKSLNHVIGIGENCLGSGATPDQTASEIVCIGDAGLDGWANNVHDTVAIGNGPMNGFSTPVSGTDNVAIGTGALYKLTSGSFNTAVGEDAGFQNLTGSHNTFIGDESGPTTGVSTNGSTALGYNAKVTTDNEIVIGASNVTQTIIWGPINVNNGTNTVFRCATAGALPVGAMTINAASCGTTADTGLRVQ